MKKNEAAQLFSTLLIIWNVSWVARSCDNEKKNQLYHSWNKCQCINIEK